MRSADRCKAVDGLFIGSLNLRGGYRARKNELLDLAKDYGVDILALSDIRAKGQSEELLNGYKVGGGIYRFVSVYSPSVDLTSIL